MKNKRNIAGTIRESLGSFKSSFLKSWIPCLLFPTNCKLTHSSPLFLPYLPIYPFFSTPLFPPYPLYLFYPFFSTYILYSLSTSTYLSTYYPSIYLFSTYYSLYCLLKLIKKTDISFRYQPILTYLYVIFLLWVYYYSFTFHSPTSNPASSHWSHFWPVLSAYALHRFL